MQRRVGVVHGRLELDTAEVRAGADVAAAARVCAEALGAAPEAGLGVFYVTDESGGKLAGTRLETLREELASRVTEMQREERESERPARRNGLP